jgi:hypothetical protein
MSFRDWQPQYVADEIAACESSPRHGGEASRGKRYSKYITRHQAKNLLEALSFADKRGLRLNVAIDICWPMFPGVVDERTRFARCQQRLRRKARRPALRPHHQRQADRRFQVPHRSRARDAGEGERVMKDDGATHQNTNTRTVCAVTVAAPRDRGVRSCVVILHHNRKGAP